MDIDTMEAGRELDALVAEKVMGKNITRARDETGVFRLWWLDAYECEDTLYSTDIGAAWKVVSRLIDLDWHPTVWYEPAGDESWACECMSYRDGDYPLGLAGSAPLAICRAALKAL